MSVGLRVLLAADEAAGARALRLLERSPHVVAGVAAKRPESTDSNALWSRASDLGAPLLEARRLKTPDVIPEIADLRPDVLLNVHSLYKVHGEVLDQFPVGAWNLHPGPLPEAGGINVPSWAIALGHRDHGVTLHRMTENYDEGSIAYEDRFPIPEGATGLTLSATCATRGVVLVRHLIEQLADDPGDVPAAVQDASARHLFPMGQPNDGLVDWAQDAQTVAAQVRAADFRPYPSPWKAPVAQVAERRMSLYEVEVGDPTDASPGTVQEDDDQSRVAASDRWVRIIEADTIGEL